jgi:hypothetical protein
MAAAVVIETPMHKDEPRDALMRLEPMGNFGSVKDIVDAVLYRQGWAR